MAVLSTNHRPKRPLSMEHWGLTPLLSACFYTINKLADADWQCKFNVGFDRVRTIVDAEEHSYFVYRYR